MTDDTNNTTPNKVEPYITMLNGEIVKMDINLMHITEYRQLFAEDTSEGFGDEMLAKVSKKDVEFIQHLGYIDYQKVIHKFWQLIREAQRPDPN